MAIDAPQNPRQTSPASEWALWFGIAAGPVAWGLHLLASYGLASLFACEMNWVWLIQVVTVIAALVAGFGTVFAWREWNRRDENVSAGLNGVGSRQGFMAALGMLLGTLTFVGIVLAGAPTFVIDACA